jgi:hypothetical protein
VKGSLTITATDEPITQALADAAAETCDTFDLLQAMHGAGVTLAEIGEALREIFGRGAVERAEIPMPE